MNLNNFFRTILNLNSLQVGTSLRHPLRRPLCYQIIYPGGDRDGAGNGAGDDGYGASSGDGEDDNPYGRQFRAMSRVWALKTQGRDQ